MKDDNKKKFNTKMQKKLVVLFLCVLLAFGGLSGRLVLIAREDGTRYQKQVFSQQYYDSTTIPFRRGDIVDAKGTKLATSIKVYNLIIDASVMTYSSDYLEPTLNALGIYFPQLDMAVIRTHVTQNKNSQWYVALKRLSYDEISGFQMAQAENSNIKGVWFQEEYKRVYPDGALAPDVIGFMRADNQGQYGLEEYYNDILNGTNGREYGYLNDDSTLERTIKPAVDGYTIHSTIDANIQSIVVKYLKQFNEEHKDAVKEGNGAENLGCIIMEVNTGRILAMASYPTFDLNSPRDASAMFGANMVESVTNQNGYQEIRKTSTIINQEVVDGMSEEQLYLNLNNLWKNYCISCTYEPGSTIKPFTVATALETGAITGNEVYVCNGSREVGGHEIKCHAYKTGGHGQVSVQDSIAWSCNVALMKMAESLGNNKFCTFQEIFNFGLKTNVDLAGEARTNTLLVDADVMRAADLATNSFGQNFNVTMIQMVAGYCSLINGGYYYEPHMVDKITNANGATIQNIEPRVLKQTVSESTSQLIRQYCRETVMGATGTGKAARPAGYAIGGKTGTAETLPRKNNEYVVSFMGYAPADDPQIAIYVVVDRANAPEQDKSSFASGIVKNILSEVLPYMNIYMTEELSEAEIRDLEARQLEITTMYAQQPEDGALEGQEGSEGENQPGNGDNSAEFTDVTGETGTRVPAWRTYPIDPATGYRKNPETGELIDANTGEPIEGNNSAFSDEVQPNPNLPQGQLEE